MSFNNIWQIIYEGVVYDAVKFLLAPLVMTTAFGLVLRTVFGKLQEKREIAIFSICSFCAFCMLFLVVGARVQQPEFVGGVQSVLTGAAGERDTVAMITMGITNSGNMQSIVKNISVTARINGNDYEGMITPPPKTFTFNLPNMGESTPSSLTYHSEDDILSKAMFPIPSGGMMLGTLYVIFRDVAPEAFKGGADFTVGYEDVLSRRYTASAKSTAKMSTNIGTFPGLHTDMVCRVPPNLLPK